MRGLRQLEFIRNLWKYLIAWFHLAMSFGGLEARESKMSFETISAARNEEDL